MRQIHVTENDLERLQEIIYVGRSCAELDQNGLHTLESELDQAVIIPADEINENVITMHSKVRIRNLESGEEMVFTLVYPRAADLERGRFSVLSPLGAALLGYQVGDIVDWRIPDGIRKLKILEVEYQPEAAGHFHL